MRVTVIGASGGIGREFVRQAIEADHEVTAVIRDSARGGAAVREWERVPVGGPGRLQVAVVDTLSPGELIGAVSGRDAVVSALGPQGAPATRPSTREACGQP
jgi:putative NADH-flavin reductase